jgi:hypothetical protein
MDAQRFKQGCESTILVEELPPLSKLRQKVAGCYALFGMCPEGEVVGLDVMGNVHCLRAERRQDRSLCEETGVPCDLEAKPSRILGVIHLLRDFMVSNFVTREGVLPEKPPQEAAEETLSIPEGAEGTIGRADYDDEDRGISRYLSKEEKAKRRERP